MKCFCKFSSFRCYHIEDQDTKEVLELFLCGFKIIFVFLFVGFISFNIMALLSFHSIPNVIDETKDLWELPRFPINEKYGELNRLITLMKTLPFKYTKIIPEDKYLLQASNPPNVKIFFRKNIQNLKQIN